MAAYQRLQKAGVVGVLDHINKPAIIFTHSQGGPSGWLAADARPDLVKAVIAIEPNGPPFILGHPHNNAPGRMWGVTDIPVEYEPPISDPAEFHLASHPSPAEGMIEFKLQDESEGRVVHQLKNLRRVPVLVEVGEASYHARYDHATVAFLRQAGVQCDFIRLEDLGIKGNGHMQMLELNNLEIAEVLRKWIDGKFPPP